MARRFNRGNSRIVTRGPRRQTLWIGLNPAFVTTSTAGTLAFGLNAAADALRPFTIIRTHLELMLTSDQSASSESYGAAIGMCVVSDQASAIGATAVPQPSDDSGSDLFYLHQNMWGDFLLDTAVGFDASAGRRYTVDSKAMRTVNEDQDNILTVQNFQSTVGAGSIVAIVGRQLIKLH